MLDLCEKQSKEFQLAGENVVFIFVLKTMDILHLLEVSMPEALLWNSILSAFESICKIA